MTSKKLIHNECANYLSGLNHIQNYCCLLDKPCVFFNDIQENVRCNYFEDSVLPLNPDLQFRYRKNRRLSTVQLMRTCKSCLQPFAGNKRQKYCAKCIEARRREQSRLRMRIKRKTS